jgi:rhodanese-related sulfurtransferase
MKRKSIVLVLVPLLVFCFTVAALGDSHLPKKKQTTLGLYVNAKEAFTNWHVHPDKIHIVDVRTPEEYIFVGHAPMAVNIPVQFVRHAWDADKKKPVMEMNPKFVDQVKQKYSATDTLYVMCRSGGRSAVATNKLAEAGFKTVYNITDGFEGDTVKDENSYFHGKRYVNGWRNSGAPWTYKLSAEQMYLP